MRLAAHAHPVLLETKLPVFLFLSHIHLGSGSATEVFISSVKNKDGTSIEMLK